VEGGETQERQSAVDPWRILNNYLSQDSLAFCSKTSTAALGSKIEYTRSKQAQTMSSKVMIDS
jgi:hypothetical protein